MRKLLLPGLVLTALFVACENKSPVGPSGVGPGGVTVSQTTSSTTTTTSTPTTTSTTTTTTTVTGSLSRRYVAFQPPPNVPADMTLFFQLLTTPSVLSSIVQRLPFLGTDVNRVTENEYKVTGVYVMLNGTAGAVDGELGEALDPLQTGGFFEGTLTAKVQGCTAEREFSGQLGPQTLTWTGGNTLHDCPGSPLSFSSFTLLRADGGAPLPTTTVPPTTTTTTTSVPTTSSTTSTTTTTTAVACSYTLAPTSASVPAAGGTGQIVIGTLPTCPWTAQSFASWLTVTPPSGTGPASVQYVAAPNVNGPSRTGTLVIGGVTFTVTQAAPVPPDLVSVLAPAAAAALNPCGTNASGQHTVTVQIGNRGLGDAVVSSFARITFTNPASPTPNADQFVPSLAAGAAVIVTFGLPGTCYVPVGSDSVCAFSIKADATDVVFESDETNNTVTGSCTIIG